MVAAVEVRAEDILRALQTPEMREPMRNLLWDIFGWWLGAQALRRLEHLLSDEFYPRIAQVPALVGTRANFGAHYKPAVVAPETTVTLPVVPPLQPYAGAETAGTILTATGKEEVATPHIWGDGITKKMARALLRGYGREELVWGQGSLWANIGMLASDISALSLQTSTLDAIVDALKKQVDAFAQVQIPEVSERVIAGLAFGASRWTIPRFFDKLIGDARTDLGWTGDVRTWGTAVSKLAGDVANAITQVLSHSGALESATRSAFGVLPNTADDLSAAAQTFATDAFGAVRDGVSSVIDAVGNTTLRPIGTSLKSVADGAASIVSKIKDTLENMVGALFTDFGARVNTTFQNAATGSGSFADVFGDGGATFRALTDTVAAAADEFEFWFKAVGEFGAMLRIGSGAALKCTIDGRDYWNHYRFFFYLDRTRKGRGCTNSISDIRRMMDAGYRVVYWYIRTWAPSIGSYLTGDAIPKMMEFAVTALAGAIQGTVQLLSRQLSAFTASLQSALDGFRSELAAFGAELSRKIRAFSAEFDAIRLPTIPDLRALGLTVRDGVVTPDILTIDRYLMPPTFSPVSVRLPALPVLPALPTAPTLPANADFARVVRDP